MSEKQYYYLDYNDKKLGPYTLTEISDIGLLAEVLVWKEGMADWQPIKTVPEFAVSYSEAPKKSKGPSAKVMLMRLLAIILGIFGIFLLISVLGKFDVIALVLGPLFIALSILIFKKNKTNYIMSDADKGSHAGTMMGHIMNMGDD